MSGVFPELAEVGQARVVVIFSLSLTVFPPWRSQRKGQPSRRAITASSRIIRSRHARFSAKHLRPFLYDTSVTPHWIGKTDSFWYAFRNSAGTNYYRVNPKLGSKEPLFDRDKLGTQLSAMLQKPLELSQLPITRLSINDEGTKLKFVVDDLQYEYDLNTENLTKLGKAPPEPALPRGGPGGRGLGERSSAAATRTISEDSRTTTETPESEDQNQNQTEGNQAAGPGRNVRDYKNVSPDKKSFLFVKKFNLYLAETDKEDAAVALTTDGIEDYSFSGGFGGGGGGGRGLGNGNGNGHWHRQRHTRPVPTRLDAPAVWSSDSKSFYITRSDARGVKELFVINSLATPRPTLEKYKYPLPGEEESAGEPSFMYTKGDQQAGHEASSPSGRTRATPTSTGARLRRSFGSSAATA